MEAFLLKALKRLRKEAPRRLKDFRTSCDELIGPLEENLNPIKKSEDIDRYVSLLLLACDTKTAKVMEIALDALHYLIEHGYLRGQFDRLAAMRDDSLKPLPGNQMMQVVEMVSRCSDEYDDNVQLQVIKVLLVAITSEYCNVHEGGLLLAVRACFHVNLITKNQANKTTAKAALTQMLSVVNQRMEVHETRLKASASASTPPSQSPSSSSKSKLDKQTVEIEDGDDVAKLDSADSEDANVAPLSRGTLSSSVTVSESYNGFSEGGDGNGFDESSTGDEMFPSVYHKDAFLVYRALCKLSMKSLQDDHGSLSDPIVMQNKILSLELILHILVHCGSAFRTGEKFVHASKSYLCVSIMGNCTSQNPTITSLSLQVFVALMESFKDHLKSELEVFVSNIFLRILESENSPHEHKRRVLDVLDNIISDPSALVEIFINYDCDFEAIDLFRRIVDAFSKITKQASQSKVVDFMSTKRFLQEEYAIRSRCCEGLVTILKSIMKTAGFPASTEVDIVPKNVPRRLSALDVLQKDSELVNSAEPLDDELSGAQAVEAFDRKQRVQEEIETGILKFNLSTKKGIAYLVSHGHIESSPQSVAAFFHQYQDRIDKTAIGEYLGREREYENGFCLKVLHEYVDMMDFTNMKFEAAIRYFLRGFRLPGEAQKIDRIMEKFAERYYLQNRGTFPSADMAFILAFSTIMLQTNLHNPAIRDDKRMTKEQFIKQNKGISSDGELSDDMLIQIYEKIAAEPISLKQDDGFVKKAKKDDQAFLAFPTSTDKKRKEAYDDERKEMIRLSEAMFRQKLRSKRLSFVRSAQTLEPYARPMFEIAWPPMLSVFSQILETNDDSVLVASCLQGFQCSIQIACTMDLSVARSTFVTSIVKFTTLDSVRSLQQKHIDAMKLVLDIAIREGDFLNESWDQVLLFVSRLSRLQLFADGVHTDDMFFSDHPNHPDFKSRKHTLSSDPFKFFSGLTKAETVRILEESNAELIMKDIDSIRIDKLFVNSQSLSNESVDFFIKALCAVSLQEISTSGYMNALRGRERMVDISTPRVFSLQKLVEVADYNMHTRSRIAWANIWNELANHFAQIGVNQNYALAMYAVDSLKQLSIKFLRKDELSNFNFQRVFLKPFELIMCRSQSSEIKELILRCLDIMIRACATNIRSGWKSIFAVFEVAASSDRYEISSIAFEITERLINEQFELLIFDFVELMNSLVAFVKGAHTYLALSALTHLSKCADLLAKGAIAPALENVTPMSDSATNSTQTGQIKEDASVFRVWWPLLLGLSARVSDSRYQVRNRALEVLLNVLQSYGGMFTEQTWNVIFKGVLLPMVDSAKTDFTKQIESKWPTENPPHVVDPFSWISTTASNVLSACSELFIQFKLKGLTTNLLPDLLGAIEGCVCQEVESLARIGLQTFYHLVVSLGCSDSQNRIEIQDADLICDRLCQCLRKNLCLNFSDAGEITLSTNSVVDFKKFFAKCPIESRVLCGGTENQKNIGGQVTTMYGIGRIMQIMGKDETLGVGPRKRVVLSWGASLYTKDMLIPFSDEENTLTDAYPWVTISKSVMTSMVITLEISRIIGELLNSFYTSWTIEHKQKFIEALATCYDHASCFNSNSNLRNLLHEKKFMRFIYSPTRLPHLADQEVLAGTNLLSFILKLHSEGKGGSTSDPNVDLSNVWLSWIFSAFLNKYVELDHIFMQSPLNSDIGEYKAALTDSVILSLRGILSFSTVQFKYNISWILVILPKLILCNDRAIRAIVKEIYECHMHSFVR